MKRLPLFICVGGAWLVQLAGQSLSADTIVFTNGAKLEGQITEEDEQQVTMDIEGGSLTVRRAEIASIVTSQKSREPETLQSYGQKMARWMEDFTIENRGTIETAISLTSGAMSPTATIRAFEQYQEAFSSLKQQLDRLVPPPELQAVHALLLQATESKIEACRWFKLATQKHDDALYSQAATAQEHSKELMEQALAQLDSVLGITP